MSSNGELLSIINGVTDKVGLKPGPSKDDATVTQSLPVPQDTSWADGLRGIAAVFVMFSHMTLCFARYIVRPATGEVGSSDWMQRPFLRLVGQGPAWVACFIILSGFVNALKPVKLARAGKVDTALSNLAVSSFRRTFRLFLPATTATVISWFICQFGAYQTALNSDAYWLRITSPSPSQSWLSAVKDLLRAIQTTWLYNPENPYDQPQWALLYLLQGSMFVFTALLVTVNLAPRFRVLTLIVCWFWSWNWGIRIGDPMVGVNVFAGILLAELKNTSVPASLNRYSVIFFLPLVAVALLLMSFPADFQNMASWSNSLLKWHYILAPSNAEVSRFWPTIGAQLLCLTILCSSHLRRLLSHPILLWLGKISFPLYLLHGTFMRSILAWLLFAGQSLTPFEEEKRNVLLYPDGTKAEAEAVVVMRYGLPSPIVFVVVLPFFFVMLGVTTHYWSKKLEPRFGDLTRRAEELMFAKEDRPTQQLPMVRPE